ncbi:ABC transporter ATP-binding protein [Chitinimonas sp. PSY-7]|uniref:ATP-binding cassette domain-containing protein n=1 Tax=Chitinimonas sp. PSY-7 TaxID=3459088 RepID=UPI0040402921
MNMPGNTEVLRPHLSVEKLVATHGTREVLHGVDVTVYPGELLAIVGPNGCGKSTLLRCMARLHQPSAGKVLLDGQDMSRLRAREVAKQLALLPQSPIAPEGISVAGLVRHGRHPHQGLFSQWSSEDERAVRHALAATEVSALAERRLDELSGGQRQRCWLAMALAQETPILLLDEPTSMLDLGHQLEVLGQLKRLAMLGHSVVLVLHDLAAAARYADRLLALRDGRVIAHGTPRTVVTPDLIQQLYGVDADVLHAPGDGAPVVVPKVGSRAPAEVEFAHL